MTIRRIHPRELKAHPKPHLTYDVRDVRQMIDSWRGVPRSQVPEEVKVIAWLEEMMTEMAQRNWQKELERQAIAKDYDSIVQISEGALAGFRERVRQRARQTVAHVGHATAE